MTKIVIIGGVAGGASAAARARRLSEDAEIIMFERGQFVSFANCGLPYHIGGDIQERSKLLLQTPESFLARFNVDVRVMNEVVDIDRHNKKVTVKNLLDNTQYSESYDFLLLSPGAAPIVPPISGIDNPLTHSLRNIPDMDRILATLKNRQPTHATVVGGGFIGLEMMEAFHQLGIQTSLIEMADQVMTPVDREMAGFAHAEIKDKGIDLRLNIALESVEHLTESNTLKLTLNNGEQLETGILIMAIGVKPETKLAQQAGLQIGELGGIWVNEQMQTSDPSIYAVGDAVEEIDFVTGKQTLVHSRGLLTARAVWLLTTCLEEMNPIKALKVLRFVKFSTLLLLQLVRTRSSLSARAFTMRRSMFIQPVTQATTLVQKRCLSKCCLTQKQARSLVPKPRVKTASINASTLWPSLNERV